MRSFPGLYSDAPEHKVPVKTLPFFRCACVHMCERNAFISMRFLLVVGFQILVLCELPEGVRGEDPLVSDRVTT
jgi:hypothetical protein